MTWFMCFCSMLAIYFLISWLPTLIRMEGMPTGLSIGAAIALNIGGVIGGVLIGAAGDKVGSARALASAYILEEIAIRLIEPVGQHATLLHLISCLYAAFSIGVAYVPVLTVYGQEVVVGEGVYSGIN